MSGGRRSARRMKVRYVVVIVVGVRLGASGGGVEWTEMKTSFTVE